MPYEECGDYGLLGEIMEADEYTDLTDLTYAEIEEPASYDPDITDDMDDHTRREREAEWKEVVEAWHTRKGALRGICDNIRDALDPKYYIALKKPIIGYKRTTAKDYFIHLDSKWCKLDTKVIKKMKENYFRGWQLAEEEDISTFIKRLNEEQTTLAEDNIRISVEDKLQHFLEEMYDSALFERRDYSEWENRPDEEKDWDEATEYYQGLIDAMDSFNENIGGTAKRAKFESAAHVKDETEKDDAALNAFLQSQSTTTELVQAVTSNQTNMATIQTEMQSMLQSLSSQLKASNAQIAASNSQIAALQKQILQNNSNKQGTIAEVKKETDTNANRGKENIHNGRVKTGDTPCQHCGGQHHNYVNGRTEDKCSGKDWPKYAGKHTPQWLIEKMNKKTGIIYKPE